MKIKKILSSFTAFAVLGSAFSYTQAAAAEAKSFGAVHNGGYIQIYSPETEEETYAQLPIVKAENLPSAYDLRDEGCVTPVRNQGAEGMCHAFAAVGACETNLLKQGLETDCDTLDLSEAQLGYFLYTEQTDPLDPLYGDYLSTPNKGADGGNGTLAAAGLAAGFGTQYEKYCSYSNHSYSEYLRYTGKYRLSKMETITRAETSDTRNQVKSWIMENGGVGIAFYSQLSLYYDNGTSYAYYAENKSFYENANHAALIVGWDDDYSKENFPEDSRPSGNGAWLVKNSYGVDMFDDGYFWLSYEDPSTGSFCSYVMEEISSFDDVYEYDGVGYLAAYTFDATANIFTAEYDCTLTEASFYMPDKNPSGTTYNIDIYHLNDNTDAPTDGTLISSSSGQIFTGGYFKVPLDKPAELLQGQQFSLVLSMTAPRRGQTVYLPVEETTALTETFIMKCHADSGESYVYSDGEWTDIAGHSGDYGDFGNIPLKAFAVRSEEYESLQLQAAIELAEKLSSKSDILSSAVTDGAAALNSSMSSAALRSGAAETILAILETESGRVQYPELIYADFGIMRGDSDGDGTISIADAARALTVYAVRASNQTLRLRAAEEYAMDMASDGTIDMSDGTEILTAYARNAAGL